MFSSRETKSPDTTAIAAALEAQAVEAECEALAKAAELLADYEDEHRRQCDGYVFDCRRWGDYLTLFVDRGGNRDATWSPKPLKVAASLNIGACTRIDVAEGSPPSRRHSLAYEFRVVRDKDDPIILSSGDRYLRPNTVYSVAPVYPHLPAWRPLLTQAAEAVRGNIVYGHDRGHEIWHRTKGYPAPAEDDQVHFNGIGHTLYVPAGMGHDVVARIMAEIERGWERPSETLASVIEARSDATGTGAAEGESAVGASRDAQGLVP